MALYALVSHVNMSFPVWAEPFKLSSQGVRFPGGWGVRVVYRLERVLSTETSLLPWHMTRLLPGHVVIAFLKVIRSASGVSHDLQHITFLSTNITKPFSFSLSFSHTHTFRHHLPTHGLLMSHPIMSNHTDRVSIKAVWCVNIKLGWGWCQQLSHGG